MPITTSLLKRIQESDSTLTELNISRSHTVDILCFDDFKKLTHALSTNKTITAFRILEFSNFIDYSEGSVIKELAAALPRLINLTILYLNLSLQTTSMTALTMALPQLKKLTQLSLPEVSYNSEKEVNEFIKIISTLHSLRKLKLRIAKSTPKPILIILINNLAQIDTLNSLDLTYCSISNYECGTIARLIYKMQNLTELYLNHNEFDDKGWRIISEELDENKTLTTLFYPTTHFGLQPHCLSTSLLSEINAKLERNKQLAKARRLADTTQLDAKSKTSVTLKTATPETKTNAALDLPSSAVATTSVQKNLAKNKTETTFTSTQPPLMPMYLLISAKNILASLASNLFGRNLKPITATADSKQNPPAQTVAQTPEEAKLSPDQVVLFRQFCQQIQTGGGVVTQQQIQAGGGIVTQEQFQPLQADFKEFKACYDQLKLNLEQKLEAAEKELRDINKELDRDPIAVREKDEIAQNEKLTQYQQRLYMELSRFIMAYCLSTTKLPQLTDNKKGTVLNALGNLPIAGSFLKIFTVGFQKANDKYRYYQINHLADLFRDRNLSLICLQFSRKLTLAKKSEIIGQANSPQADAKSTAQGLVEDVRAYIKAQANNHNTIDTTGLKLSHAEKQGLLDGAILIEKILSGAVIDEKKDLIPQFMQLCGYAMPVNTAPAPNVTATAAPTPSPVSSAVAAHALPPTPTAPPASTKPDTKEDSLSKAEVLALFRQQQEETRQQQEETRKQHEEMRKQQEEIRKQQTIIEELRRRWDEAGVVTSGNGAQISEQRSSVRTSGAAANDHTAQFQEMHQHLQNVSAKVVAHDDAIRQAQDQVAAHDAKFAQQGESQKSCTIM